MSCYLLTTTTHTSRNHVPRFRHLIRSLLHSLYWTLLPATKSRWRLSSLYSWKTGKISLTLGARSRWVFKNAFHISFLLHLQFPFNYCLFKIWVFRLLHLSAFFSYIFFSGVVIIIPKTLVPFCFSFYSGVSGYSISFKSGIERKIGGCREDLWLSEGIVCW